MPNRPLRVFLCHASGDKPAVINLYKRLVKDGVDAWLDKEKLVPGQNWKIEIPKAVRSSDIVIVCLSSQSATKEGFVQKEIKFALDAADEKPEGTIFIIPARLENCNVPDRISQFHWVDLFSDDGYELLLRALKLRASTINIAIKPATNTNIAYKNIEQAEKPSQSKNTVYNSKETSFQKYSLSDRVKGLFIGAMIGAISGLLVGGLISLVLGESNELAWLYPTIIVETITGALLGILIIHKWKIILICAIVGSIIWMVVDSTSNSFPTEIIIGRGLILGGSIGGLFGAIIEKIISLFITKTKE